MADPHGLLAAVPLDAQPAGWILMIGGLGYIANARLTYLILYPGPAIERLTIPASIGAVHRGAPLSTGHPPTGPGALATSAVHQVDLALVRTRPAGRSCARPPDERRANRSYPRAAAVTTGAVPATQSALHDRQFQLTGYDAVNYS